MLQSVYSVIVTYNGMQWIEKCLDSLIASSYNNHILVIDNGSQDGTCAFIKENYPLVRLIEAGRNLGFGQGNNIGLSIAISEKAGHIFLLNQDAWVERDTISRLVRAQTEHPEYGIISPIHLNGRGNDFDDHFYFYLSRSGMRELVYSAILEKEQDLGIIPTPFVNAAAWLISVDCLVKTGGFDPIFFHYGEDDNFAHRVIFKGYKIGILTTARIYHDKERPAEGKARDIRSKSKKDWINFLDQACNIGQANYPGLMIRRFCRYSLAGLLCLLFFNKSGIYYNFSMAINISRSFSKVRRSRNSSMKKTTPYLDLPASRAFQSV